MSLASPLRNRYAGLSPTFSTPTSPLLIAATTMVLPMPAQSGLSRAASNTAVLACLHARLRRSRPGPSSPSSASTLVSGVTAHSVPHDEQGVEARLVAPDDHRVLVLLPFEARVGRRGDLKAHFRDGQPPRTEK